MKRVICLFLILVSSMTSHAESRSWQDVEGNALYGEYVMVCGHDVCIRDAEGTTYKISLERLSEADQLYIQLLFRRLI